MICLKSSLLSLCLTVLIAASHKALVPVTCDKGSSATCTYTDPATQGEVTLVAADRNQDGKVEFTVPDTVTTVTITKYSDGTPLTYDTKPQATGS